jgi:threonine dehydratase
LCPLEVDDRAEGEAEGDASENRRRQVEAMGSGASLRQFREASEGPRRSEARRVSHESVLHCVSPFDAPGVIAGRVVRPRA